MPKIVNALTDAQVKNAKPKDKPKDKPYKQHYPSTNDYGAMQDRISWR
jgi:hypothetical protein